MNSELHLPKEVVPAGSLVEEIVLDFDPPTLVSQETVALMPLVAAGRIATRNEVSVLLPDGPLCAVSFSGIVVTKWPYALNFPLLRFAQLAACPELPKLLVEVTAEQFARNPTPATPDRFSRGDRVILRGRHDHRGGGGKRNCGRETWAGRFAACFASTPSIYRVSRELSDRVQNELLRHFTSDSGDVNRHASWLLCARVAVAYHILAGNRLSDLNPDDFGGALAVMQLHFAAITELKSSRDFTLR